MNKKSILIWLIFGLVMLASFRVSQARSLSMHFVDEEDHIAFANYINQGYKLHADLQNNHQPLVYFGSALIQKFSHPENIFMLIRRHRQAMFFYGVLWSLLLVWRFKEIGLMTVVFLEFLKYYLFGNLWLMESLAVYPTIYLFAKTLEVWLENKLPTKIETIFLGFCSFLIIFNMVPLWPWLSLVWLIILIKIKKQIIWPMLGLIIPTALLFVNNYSPVDWFRETIYNNYKFAIPALSPFHGFADYLRVIFFPFLAYFSPGSLQAQFIVLFFTGYLLACRLRPKLLLIYPLLLLANNRVLSPDSVYYQGFHLLPWMGLMILVFSFCFKKLNNAFKIVFLIWAAILFLNKSMPYRFKTDQQNEYYINFSTQENTNEAIKIVAKPGDRLAGLNNQPIVYWNTGTKPATRQLVYYAWEPNIKELRENYEKVFYGDNPPEIIYGNKETNLLIAKYTSIQRDGADSLLYIRNDRYQEISTEQWQKLIYWGFSRE